MIELAFDATKKIVAADVSPLYSSPMCNPSLLSAHPIVFPVRERIETFIFHA